MRRKSSELITRGSAAATTDDSCSHTILPERHFDNFSGSPFGIWCKFFTFEYQFMRCITHFQSPSLTWTDFNLKSSRAAERCVQLGAKSRGRAAPWRSRADNVNVVVTIALASQGDGCCSCCCSVTGYSTFFAEAKKPTSYISMNIEQWQEPRGMAAVTELSKTIDSVLGTIAKCVEKYLPQCFLEKLHAVALALLLQFALVWSKAVVDPQQRLTQLTPPQSQQPAIPYSAQAAEKRVGYGGASDFGGGGAGFGGGGFGGGDHGAGGGFGAGGFGGADHGAGGGYGGGGDFSPSGGNGGFGGGAPADFGGAHGGGGSGGYGGHGGSDGGFGGSPPADFGGHGSVGGGSSYGDSPPPEFGGGHGGGGGGGYGGGAPADFGGHGGGGDFGGGHGGGGDIGGGHGGGDIGGGHGGGGGDFGGYPGAGSGVTDFNGHGGDSGGGYPGGASDDHHHHDDHHDKGYWKKKLIWKPGWKKIWKPAKKQIWKPAWKKIYKPEWIPTKKAIWKDIQVPAWKKVWKPVWKEIEVPAWKDIKVPAWKKVNKPIWVPIKVPAWKEIQVPDWKKVYKPIWVPIKVPAWKEIQVPAWKKIWVPEWVKVGIPGEKHLGTDAHGWEYTSHDLWKKKLIWKPLWKKIWKTAKKQIWVEEKKLEWKEEWKQIWKPAKKQIWVEDKKLAWKEEWKQIWKPGKKQIWVKDKKLEWKEEWKQIWKTEQKQEWIEDKKLVWKEAWKEIQVPAWKEIWVPAWKKIWKPVWISEWFPIDDHHDHHDSGWKDRKDTVPQASSNQAQQVQLPAAQQQINPQQSQPVRWDRSYQVGTSPAGGASAAALTSSSMTHDLVPPPLNQPVNQLGRIGRSKSEYNVRTVYFLRYTWEMPDACNISRNDCYCFRNQELANTYGPVVGLKLGKHKFVVISTNELVKKALLTDEFNGRPQGFFFRLRSFGKAKGSFNATNDTMGGIISLMPFLRFIIPELSGYNHLMSTHEKLWGFLDEEIKLHEENLPTSQPRDLIDAFLMEIRDQTHSADHEEQSIFDRENLLILCLDLFLAGSKTTTDSLSLIFAFLGRNVNYVKELQSELDDVLGRNCAPTLADVIRLPKIESFLAEDTIILMNFYSANNDEKVWKDPQEFRPQRFLDENGKLRSNSASIPFGLGKRRCLGEVLARHTLFLFASILHYYDVNPSPDHPLPELLGYDGFVISPKPYYLKLTPRQTNFLQ
ncbi:unnamed protein product [Trichogramma brassicae]|uniref:Cytochrome P450 n=1 Tax=Trichogramma brassicae TaxID=86971 RepID=A0A6H5I7K0_9HYME|nr:unnamed protein product [Trichogramma brassicae]